MSSSGNEFNGTWNSTRGVLLMGDKPKRDRFEAGKKGDVQWKEAVKNWKMRKSETNKASYKDLKVKQQEHAALYLDGTSSNRL